MYNRLISKKSKLAVVGLGYVGLPLALEFARNVSVIGYDIDEFLIKNLNMKNDPKGKMDKKSFEEGDIVFTSNEADLAGAEFFIIDIPASIDKHKNPDLSAVEQATRTVAKYLRQGGYVVYESTFYPGCTQEVFVPMLEELTGMKCGKDFKVGYSPERMDVSDPVMSLKNTVKVVSACDNESIDVISNVYGLVVEAGIHQAPTMRTAESAKLIEDIQRDVNVALMNECSIVFNRLGVNTQDVMMAASTNRRFVPCEPGLVGGITIAKSPYNMVYKANAVNYHSHIIPSARYINDSMGEYVAKQTVKKLLAYDMPLLRARILVMGVTSQPNTSDFRNSRVVNIVRELKSYRVAVDVIDPYADSDDLEERYGVSLAPAPSGKYHAIVIAVPHNEYMGLTEDDFMNMIDPNGLVVDIYGIYRNVISQLRYWSL